MGDDANADPPPPELPVKTRVALGVGGFAEAAIVLALNSFLLFYYTQVLALEGALAGLALGIAIVFDAISDPLIGSLSDNFRSKLGRRHPFMWFSAVPLCTSFYLLFNPPGGLEGITLFAWLATTTILTRTFMTFFSVPRYALSAEAASGYAERTKVMSYDMLIGYLGGILFLVVAYTIVFAPSPEYENGMLDASAYSSLGLLGATVIAFGVLACSGLTQHLAGRLRDLPPPTERFGARRMLREARQIVSNRNFRVMFGGYLAYGLIAGLHSVMTTHMYVYFWGLVPSQMIYAPIGGFVAMLGVFFLVQVVLAGLDKKRLLITFSAVTAVDSTLVITLRLLGWFPENGDPWLLPLIVASQMIVGMGISAKSLVLRSMLADIVDEQELVTGERQEGMFYSSVSFTSKAMSGLGTVAGGIVLSLIGFPPNVEASGIAPDVVFRMGVFMGPLLGACHLVPIYIYSFYSLDHTRLREIQQQLGRLQPAAVPVSGGR